ncbi:hypothetical protein HDK64DRAFT_45499 [Phyllosticta capitalensis]
MRVSLTQRSYFFPEQSKRRIMHANAAAAAAAASYQCISTAVKLVSSCPVYIHHPRNPTLLLDRRENDIFAIVGAFSASTGALDKQGEKKRKGGGLTMTGARCDLDMYALNSLMVARPSPDDGQGTRRDPRCRFLRWSMRMYMVERLSQTKSVRRLFLHLFISSLVIFCVPCTILIAGRSNFV